MAITMVNASNFDDGQDAVGTECVAEWQNIIDNALNLVSPWTGNMSAGGYRLTTLALGTAASPAITGTGANNTGVYFSGTDGFNISSLGSLAASFLVNGVVLYSNGLQVANLNSATDTLQSQTISIISQVTDITLTPAAYINLDGPVRVGNAAVTGVGDNCLVLTNTSSLQWINAAGSTAADIYIQAAATNNMQFCVPDQEGQRYYFLWGADALFGLTQQFDGPGIVFNGLSSADHSAPASGCVIYTILNAGKTELRAIFPSGAAQLLAAEP